MRHLICLGVASVALFASPPVRASDYEDCFNLSGPPAIAACTRAIDSKKYTSSALGLIHTARGFEYMTAGNRRAARADFDRAIELSSFDIQAFLNRGLLSLQAGDHDGAIRDFDAVIYLKPDYTKALANRGLAYERKGNVAKARADYRAALAAPQDTASGREAAALASAGLARIGQ